jgi:hypothetical protein
VKQNGNIKHVNALLNCAHESALADRTAPLIISPGPSHLRRDLLSDTQHVACYVVTMAEALVFCLQKVILLCAPRTKGTNEASYIHPYVCLNVSSPKILNGFRVREILNKHTRFIVGRDAVEPRRSGASQSYLFNCQASTLAFIFKILI